MAYACICRFFFVILHTKLYDRDKAVYRACSIGGFDNAESA